MQRRLAYLCSETGSFYQLLQPQVDRIIYLGEKHLLGETFPPASLTGFHTTLAEQAQKRTLDF